MADTVISILLQNLSQLLANEANLLFGLEDKVTSLQDELKIIDAYLKYVDRKKISNEVLDAVVDQIKDAAHESEDVIDTFIARVAQHRRRNTLSKIIHGAGHSIMLHEVSGKIEKLRNGINEIHSNKIKYDFKDDESTSTGEDAQRWELINRRRRTVEEDDVVGLLHDSSVVIQQLTEGGSHSQLTVVSIIGMGGLGKTTLARKIYNDSQVKKNFNFCAWVYVSNDFRPRELLITLLRCLSSSLSEVELKNKVRECLKGRRSLVVLDDILKTRDWDSLSEDELNNVGRECLKGRRYLVVLDDIWKTQDWDRIRDVFPDDGIGSRILITSRSKETASHTGCTQHCNLSFLSPEESWELFRKKVFRGEDCPSNLEPLGRKIAESCRGLPLSIVVLSGFLANKQKSQPVWSKIMGHVNWYLAEHDTQVKDIVLKLSYDSLPQRLKPCFLYFGVFPEDFEVHVQSLIQKWVAEGFIQQCGARNLEDVAEDYLYELVDRSLIQVASRRSDGGVKTCRIHDLLRDLCLDEGKKDKFLEVCMDTNILTQRMTKPRRLSIHCNLHSYVSSRNYDHSCTRSLFCFKEEHYSFTSKHWKWLVKGFKLARVLDLEQVALLESCSIFSKLEALIHLRYLRLNCSRTTTIKVIPDSICNLWNLETLDLGHPYPFSRRWFVFPSGMWKLRRLRHIRTHAPLLLSDFSGSDTKIMWNLQTLSFVTLNEEAASLVQKGMFPNLRKLGLLVKSMNNKVWQLLLQGLEYLTNLNALKLFLALEYDSRREVELVALPAHITKLTLVDVRYGCVSRIMKNSANLTNLQILKLSSSGNDKGGFKLHFFAGCFPQLQVFQVEGISVFGWELDNGAMPCLQRLVLKNCCNFRVVPDELWSLPALRQVQVSGLSEELTNMLQNLEMKNGVKLIIQQQ